MSNQNSSSDLFSGLGLGMTTVYGCMLAFENYRIQKDGGPFIYLPDSPEHKLLCDLYAKNKKQLLDFYPELVVFASESFEELEALALSKGHKLQIPSWTEGDCMGAFSKNSLNLKWFNSGKIAEINLWGKNFKGFSLSTMVNFYSTYGTNKPLVEIWAKDRKHKVYLQELDTVGMTDFTLLQKVISIMQSNKIANESYGGVTLPYIKFKMLKKLEILLRLSMESVNGLWKVQEAYQASEFMMNESGMIFTDISVAAATRSVGSTLYIPQGPFVLWVERQGWHGPVMYTVCDPNTNWTVK